MTEFRAYFFTNMYISDIQRGIQTAHCATTLYMKYPVNRLLSTWASIDKTMIVLNGGYSSHLHELIYLFKDQVKYPWAYFKESQAALDGALTCVGIILPDYIYESTKLKDIKLDYSNIMYDNILHDCDNNIDRWLIDNLGNYRLA